MALGSGLPAPHPLLPTEALFFLEGILVHQVCIWQLTLVRQMVQAMCRWRIALLFLELPQVSGAPLCPESKRLSTQPNCAWCAWQPLSQVCLQRVVLLVWGWTWDLCAQAGGALVTELLGWRTCL